MTKRLRIVEPTVQRLCPREPAVRRLDPQAVADALGAEPDTEHLQGHPGPLTLYALRDELFRWPPKRR